MSRGFALAALFAGALAHSDSTTMTSITSMTAFPFVESNTTYANAYKVEGSIVAPKGAKVLTVAVIGDYGWAGWKPSPDHFCLEVLPRLESVGILVPNEVVNDCDPGDKEYITNATALQSVDTSDYVGQVCAMKNCSAFVSVGDNFYDSGVDFTTAGILRFEDAWVNMYSQGVFDYAPWYQCLGNHDIVPGQAGVTFQTQVAPLYDRRWYFGTKGLPYYTYDLVGEDWTATFVVVDSDCFVSSYQKPGSVYNNPYTSACYKSRQEQVDFLSSTFAASKADWKFLQLHHPYYSVSTNETDLEPLIEVVVKHQGTVLNGHDHCMAHYYGNNTNFILSGGAGYPQAGDCNNGIALGPYTKFLGANMEGAINDPPNRTVATLARRGGRDGYFISYDVETDDLWVANLMSDDEIFFGDPSELFEALKDEYRELRSIPISPDWIQAALEDDEDTEEMRVVFRRYGWPSAAFHKEECNAEMTRVTSL